MEAKDLAGLFSGAGQIGAALLPYTMSEDEIQYLTGLAEGIPGEAKAIGEEAAGAAAFKPFSIKTGTGSGVSMPVDPVTGVPTLTYDLSADEAALQKDLLSSATTMAGETPVTADTLYSQIRAMQTPEEERQRLALENRLAAQGRLGVQTAAYGGTPEQLAQAKAQQEAMNTAAFQASQLAPQLQGMNIANITGMLGAAYTPENQLIAGLMPGIDLSRIGTSAGLGESEAIYKSGIAGLEGKIGGLTAASNIEAARNQALALALSGMFAQPEGGGNSAGQNFFETLFGMFGGSNSQKPAVTTGQIFTPINTAPNAPEGMVDVT